MLVEAGEQTLRLFRFRVFAGSFPWNANYCIKADAGLTTRNAECNNYLHIYLCLWCVLVLFLLLFSSVSFSHFLLLLVFIFCFRSGQIALEYNILTRLLLTKPVVDWEVPIASGERWR